MRDELAATYPLLRTQLLGVNLSGLESGNALATQGRDTPLLQDEDRDYNGKSDVFEESWAATWRDVVLVNGKSERVGVYNLTEHNLADAANYATLRQLLIDLAMTDQTPWTNADEPTDINNDGKTSPLDALIVINTLIDTGGRTLPPPSTTQPRERFFDSSRDGSVTVQDALVVINHLNARSASGTSAQGEPNSAPLPEAFRVAANAFSERQAQAGLTPNREIPALPPIVVNPSNSLVPPKAVEHLLAPVVVAHDHRNDLVLEDWPALWKIEI